MRLRVLTLCVGFLQGCVAAQLGDYCRGSGLAEVDGSSVGLILGARAHRFAGSPRATFRNPSVADPQMSLELKLSPATLPWPAELDETPCKGLDWRTFRVDRIEPRLFGFPFFYWYQLAWVFIAAGICLLSFVLLQRERAAYRRSQPERGEW